jgi:hypothetical protein
MTAPQMSISKIAAETMLVPILGTAPLIVNNWAEKAKRKMLDAQQGRKAPKELRDPDADYEASFYRTKEGYGFPAGAFKSATVDSSRFYGKSMPKTQIRQFVFVKGIFSPKDKQGLVEIVGTPHMREDVVRVGISGSDLRYRAEFSEWTTVLEVTYVNSCLSRDSVLSLIDAGGLGVGVGEWRPEKGGDFGTYRIDPTREIEIL